MSIVFRLCYHPKRKTQHPLVIEDMLELAEAGQQEAVDACVIMLTDFFRQGKDSRYCKVMKGLFWELKSRSRGGFKGGSRVYFFWLGENYQEAAIVRAEYKTEVEPDVAILNDVAEIIEAYRQRKKVW
jgi:hypothetical protein